VNGTQYVYDFATASGTVVNGVQYLYDYATASGTVVNGSQYVYDYATAHNTVLNSGGTLFASGGTVDVVGAIKGGSIFIGNGTVDIQQASADNVTFQSEGIGGFELAVASAYTGKVSGFGSNNSQFIDFTHINSAGATVAYTSNSSNSGVLKVTSGGHTVASINMVGHYTTANLHPSNDGSGHLQITDPPVVEQKPGNAAATIAADTMLEVKVSDSGEVTFAGPTGTLWLDHPSTFTGKVADFGAQEGIDLPGILFGRHTTLGYSENSCNTGGTLSVKDGTPSRSLRFSATTWPPVLLPQPTATAARSSRRRRKRRTSRYR
jgi:autotransporter passenger strand-loop-strand repeat protein